MPYRILRVKTSDIDNQEITSASIDDGNREYKTMDGIHKFEDNSASKFTNLEAILKKLEIPFDSYSIKEEETDHGIWSTYRPSAEEKDGYFQTSIPTRPKGWKDLKDC